MQVSDQQQISDQHIQNRDETVMYHDINKSSFVAGKEEKTAYIQ